MYIWRLPVFAFADLTVTAVLVSVVGALLGLRAQTRNPIVRGTFSAAVVVALLMAPAVVHLFTGPSLDLAARHGVYIDPPAWMFWIPTLVAPVVLLMARALFPPHIPRAPMIRYRICFVALLLVFAVLNFSNWCSPGWCERFGFPFPYLWWSDAIVMMNGENLTAGESRIALMLNAGIAAALSLLLSRSFRRKWKQRDV